MNGRIGVFVTVALGLLLFSVGAQYLAKLDDEVSPSSVSVRPSGAAVFAELLRKDGYSVRVDRSLSPKVGPGEVAIAFVRPEDDLAYHESNTTSLSVRAQEKVRQAVREGAGAVFLPLSSRYTEAVKRAEASPTPVQRVTDGAKRTLAINPNGTPFLGGESQALYFGQGGQYVGIAPAGKGLIVNFGDGIVATNRLIDNQDNARVLLEAVRIVGGKKSVVFTETTYDAEALGLLETLGPWSQGMMYQILFVIVVAIATLGKRFGLEDIAVRTVRSSRDVADGISDTLRRGRMTGTALGLLLEDQERRTGQKPSAEANNAVNQSRLPEDEALRIARKNL
ncbi:hypothetical protein EON79_01565 [bacterium]|nr:MAG: hypothetical protein EON79_01565 [bacterium]